MVAEENCDCLGDRWIERYLPFLEREIDRLNGGQISRHYLRRARLNYREFCQSKNPAARFSTWVAIQTCGAWLAQLERAES
jgi:hypothetical protein